MYILTIFDCEEGQDPACASDSVDKLKMWADRQFGDPVAWGQVGQGRHVATLDDPEHDQHEEVYYTIDEIDVI